LLRSYANGGSSLTGLEAISNGVASFRRPTGRNARVTLVVMSSILGFLVLSTTLMAKWTHALPRASGSPTVVAQEVQAIVGHGAFAHAIYLVVHLRDDVDPLYGGQHELQRLPVPRQLRGDRPVPASPA
jgi:hypothetical protein